MTQKGLCWDSMQIGAGGGNRTASTFALRTRCSATELLRRSIETRGRIVYDHSSNSVAYREVGRLLEALGGLSVMSNRNAALPAWQMRFGSRRESPERSIIFG